MLTVFGNAPLYPGARYFITLCYAQTDAGQTPRVKPASAEKPLTLSERKIGFLHEPPKEEALPYPGQTMKISAGLSNTRETRHPLKAFISRDGRFMEVPAKEAYLDKFDRPIYEISFPAPVAEVSYQLFVVAGEEDVLASPRYIVRRSCIPQVALATGEVPSSVQGTERLQKLIEESRALENDLKGYEESLELIEELKKVIG
jgi:hypothetical protein